jgi:hypothetical protein
MRRPGTRPTVFGRALPAGFRVRTVILPPQTVRRVDQGAWRDALVTVERGEVEVVGEHGARSRFVSGDVLWLAGLPVRELRNPGLAPAVLQAVSRRPRLARRPPRRRPAWPRRRRRRSER